MMNAIVTATGEREKTLSRYCKEEKESTHVSLGLEQQTRRWEKIHF